MTRLDKKYSSSTPENWEKFRPETLLFATEVCMMDRDTKVISGDNGGFGGLAGAAFGFAIVLMLLGLFQTIDTIQTPNQTTYRNQGPWKLNRIKPITAVNIGPATPAPAKPAVAAAPVKPPAPAATQPEPKQAAAKVEETAKAEAEAKAAEEAAKAEAEAKAAEEAAKAEAEAKAAEEAAKEEAEAKAAEEAAKAEAEAKAAEEAAKAEAEAKAAEEAAKAEAEAKAAEEAAKEEAEAKAAEEAAKAEAEAKAKTAEETTKTEASAAENHEANILNTVTAWANAWSNQKVDQYINSYTSDFKPKQYKSREYWEAQRRKRLARPASINIQLSNIQISLTEDGNATVTFVQIYKSPSFSDQVRKTLVLKQESGTWKISSETAKPL